jgi:hypothetical protein
VHKSRRPRKDQRKGFTETDYARLLDAAHQQLAGPLVLVWDNLNTHVSAAMAEQVWSHLKRSLACLAKRNLAQLTALATNVHRVAGIPR